MANGGLSATGNVLSQRCQSCFVYRRFQPGTELLLTPVNVKKYQTESRWATATAERLKSWNFNTVGAGRVLRYMMRAGVSINLNIAAEAGGAGSMADFLMSSPGILSRWRAAWRSENANHTRKTFPCWVSSLITNCAGDRTGVRITPC